MRKEKPTPKFTLYVAPGTCARVPTVALEEIGCAFETALVRFKSRQNKSPEFLSLNPKGKVPTLVIDGAPLTENVAILWWLNGRFPEASLMPRTTTPIEMARQVSDLSFVSSTLHPLVTRIRIPHLFIDAETAHTEFRAKGIVAMRQFASLLEDRYRTAPWWYGENWSILDAYIHWVWFRITGAGFPSGEYPSVSDFARRIEQRPSVQRAIARETEYERVLEEENLTYVMK